MSRLAEDIDFLQRAADAAGLIIYPGGGNATFADAARVTVPAETLIAFAAELESRRLQPREYQLIDYEAAWLLRAAHQLMLHRADGESAKAERFQKLAEYLRAAIEVDLNNARKSPGGAGMISTDPIKRGQISSFALGGRSPEGSGGDRDAAISLPATEHSRALEFKRSGISVAEEKALRDRVAELETELNRPETNDWMRGVPLEAAHQRQRWGVKQDEGKGPLDWFWLIGYLAQKAATAQIAGDTQKAKHHTISTAAALANWHLHLTGADLTMRPGIPKPEGE